MQMLARRKGAMRAKDGAIVSIVVDDANGVEWQFQYRKYAGSFYKWFALGQPDPLSSDTGTLLTPTPINTNVFGAQVTLPMSGMYRWKIAGQIGAGGSNSTLTAAMYLDQTTNLESLTEVIVSGDAVSLEYDAIIAREGLSQHVWGMAYQVSVLGPNVNSQTFQVYPRAVAL